MSGRGRVGSGWIWSIVLNGSFAYSGTTGPEFKLQAFFCLKICLYDISLK